MTLSKQSLLFSLFLSLITVHNSVYAQDESESANDPVKTDSTSVEGDPNSMGMFDPLLSFLGADGEFDPNKTIDFSVLPGPFYSPEMSFGVAIVGVGLYQPDKKSQLSSVVIKGLASINGSIDFDIENQLFLNEDSRQIYLHFNAIDMDVVYYGKGYQENKIDDNLVEHHLREFIFKPVWKERLVGDVFWGVGADVSYSEANDFDRDKSKVDLTSLQKSSFSAGATALINYDSRDHVTNAREGRFLELEVSLFDKAIGSDEDFSLQHFTYNEYLPVNAEDVLAWQFKGEFSTGDVPWDRMAAIGSSGGLRGYNSGRFQDNQMMYAQIEYRLHIIGRHGMVFWTGVGAIADKVSDFSGDELLGNVGTGYRFLIKKDVNLRLDVGYGKGGTGVYLNVNEAF